MGSNGDDLLVGDNNAYQVLVIESLTLICTSGNITHTFQSKTYGHHRRIRLGSDCFGIWKCDLLYDLETLAPPNSRSVVLLVLPHSHNNSPRGKFYVGEYNGIREITMDSEGYVSDRMLLSGTGIEGIFGPFGIVGDW